MVKIKIKTQMDNDEDMDKWTKEMKIVLLIYGIVIILGILMVGAVWGMYGTNDAKKEDVVSVIVLKNMEWRAGRKWDEGYCISNCDFLRNISNNCNPSKILYDGELTCYEENTECAFFYGECDTVDLNNVCFEIPCIRTKFKNENKVDLISSQLTYE